MDGIVPENEASDEGKGVTLDQATTEAPTTERTSTFSMEVADTASFSNQQLIISQNGDTLREYDSSGLSFTEELEPLDLSFSVIPKPTYSNEYLCFKEHPKLPGDALLLRVLNDPEFLLFKVYVGKYKFHCHLQVLQAYSMYFRGYGEGKTLTSHLPIEMVTPTAFHVIYNWMLDIKKSRKGDCSIVELYSAATFMKVNELLDLVFDCFNDSCVSGSQAFGLFMEALNFEIRMFQIMLLSRIEEFFLPLVASKEFVELDFYWVRELLSIQSVGVNSEIEIFMSAVRWLSHNWPKRKAQMEKLMECVRFCLLPPPFLRFLQGEHNTLILNSICQSAKVKELVNKAFVYTSSELYELNQNIYHMLKEFHPPEQRKWIVDKRCPYHRHPGGHQGQFFTYQQFLNYLESLHDSLPEQCS